MRNRSIWLAGMLLGLLCAAVAADISGKWKAEFSTPDGTQRVNTFNFKVDGGKLSGTVAGTQDETPSRTGRSMATRSLSRRSVPLASLCIAEK